MGREQLPQPTECGSRLGKYAEKIIRSVADVPFIGKGLEAFFEFQREKAIAVLVDCIRMGEIDLIDDPQYQYLVPNAYAYFEAARSGEHEHNLRILAKLLCDGISDPHQAPYVVRNASRRLAGLSVEDLRMLVKCYLSFERCRTDPYYKINEELYFWTNDKLFSEEIGENSFDNRIIANSYLADFMSRGFLYSDGFPQLMGARYFYRTRAFDEIMCAANKIKLD